MTYVLQHATVNLEVGYRVNLPPDSIVVHSVGPTATFPRCDIWYLAPVRPETPTWSIP